MGYPRRVSNLATPLFRPVPSLLLIGVRATWEARLAEAMPSVLIFRLPDPTAASERILVTRPLVVLFGSPRPAPSVLTPLIDIATAVGSEIVFEDDIPNDEGLVPRISIAVFASEERRALAVTR